MMFQSKLAAAIKVNGKILREFKDTVYVPFGSEYSVFVKNLNSVRAVVNIEIDGQDVAAGGIVINANSSVDLERFIKNGNLMEGNKFKFIERTSSIEQHRGIGVEDGLVRISYQFEKPKPVYAHNFWKYGGQSTPISSGPTYNVGGVLRGVDYSQGQSTRNLAASSTSASLINMGITTGSNVHDGMPTMDCSFNDAGITVPGSHSTQQFTTVTVGVLEAETHVLVLKLLGETANNIPVVKPVTVKHKPKCDTCGKLNRAHAKFCVECGTALTIFA